MKTQFKAPLLGAAVASFLTAPAHASSIDETVNAVFAIRPAGSSASSSARSREPAFLGSWRGW